MNPEKRQAIKAHADAIAAILYEEANQEDLKTKRRNREVSAWLGVRTRDATNRNFFIETVTGTAVGRERQLKSILGKLPLTSAQALRLSVKSHTRLSPYLESCCVRASANVSYSNAAQDVQAYTGIKVSALDPTSLSASATVLSAASEKRSGRIEHRRWKGTTTY